MHKKGGDYIPLDTVSLKNPEQHIFIFDGKDILVYNKDSAGKPYDLVAIGIRLSRKEKRQIKSARKTDICENLLL